MKKVFALILTLAMVLSLAACGGKDAPASNGGDARRPTRATPPPLRATSRSPLSSRPWPPSTGAM